MFLRVVAIVEEEDSGESDDSMEDPLIVGKENAGMTVNDVIERARLQASKGVHLDEKLVKMLICCGCLGDRSDDINEIVECDGCGVTVHEGTTENTFMVEIIFSCDLIDFKI